MAKRISIPSLAENNLIRNNCFGQALLYYRYTGTGKAEVLPGPPAFCRFSEGTLHHIFDIDNQEHAAPESVFPWQGVFVFKFRARGKGKLRGGIRWRLSYARGDMEFAQRLTPEYELQDTFQEYRFEGTVEDFHCCVNDKIFFEVTEGFADLTGICFYYPEPSHEVAFNRPHITVLPGENFSFKCSNAKELLCCYGHTQNEKAPELIENPGETSWQLPGMGGEGMRFIGIGREKNSRNSLFVSVPPPKLTLKMRRCRFSQKPRHLLFLGDSLTAYDTGRNFTDIAGSFLPESWSYTNAGIGGDDLPRLVKRLKGKPRTYRLEDFANLWEKIPDEIFLFYGANDTKGSWKSEYKVPGTMPEEEKKLLEELCQLFKEKAPFARITIISAAPGFLPFQMEHTLPLRELGIQHTLFCIPEHIKRFNRITAAFARSKGWGYLNFYQICNSYGDLKSLFIPDDGVHLTLTGHQLLATALLEYLQKSEN